MWVSKGTGQCCPAPWALHPIPLPQGTVVGAGCYVIQQLFAGMLQPGAAHGICSCTPVAVALCLGTSGDTSVHPSCGGCATLSCTGQCVVEADGSFGAGAPLEGASGHGTPTSQSTPVSIPKRGRETWRHSGGTWPCSILLEKGLVGNLVLPGLDETGCNTLPWDSLPQGISQPMGSVPSQRAISSDSSSGC